MSMKSKPKTTETNDDHISLDSIPQDISSSRNVSSLVLIPIESHVRAGKPAGFPKNAEVRAKRGEPP